jgi:CHASE3 domain sensor protein
MFWFIVLLLLAGAGFYFYQKMMAIEREIRAEQEAAQAADIVAAKTTEAETSAGKAEQPTETIDPPVVTPEVESMAAKAEPVVDESLSLEDEVIAAVNNLPGVKQSELYNSFGDVSKNQLQKLIKELADSGKLKREKKGSSYLLYPA